MSLPLRWKAEVIVAMLLIIDNYDSFVFNIVRYCAELGKEARVVRNDILTLDEIISFDPTEIIISPGPATPAEAGVSLDLIHQFSGRVPILGVCLGHQCIGAAFGAKVVRAREPMHGRASAIKHDGTGLVAGLPTPLTVGRYHSLVVTETPEMKQKIRITARSELGEVMALTHVSHPTLGVQFHPESVLSEFGHQIFENFFSIAQEWRAHALA